MKVMGKYGNLCKILITPYMLLVSAKETISDSKHWLLGESDSFSSIGTSHGDVRIFFWTSDLITSIYLLPFQDWHLALGKFPDIV